MKATGGSPGQSEIKVNNMSILTAIDVEFGQKGFGGGNPTIYYNMLMQLESLSLLSCMEKIVPTVD